MRISITGAMLVVEGGQDRVGGLGLQQALGHGRTRRLIGARCSGRSPRFRAPGRPPGARGRPRWHRLPRRPGAGPIPSGDPGHVALGDAAVPAGARHVRSASLLSASSLAAAGMAMSGLATSAAGGRARQRPPPLRQPAATAAAMARLAFGVDLGDDLVGRHRAAITATISTSTPAEASGTSSTTLSVSIRSGFHRAAPLRRPASFLPLQHGGFRHRFGQLGTLTSMIAMVLSTIVLGGAGSLAFVRTKPCPKAFEGLPTQRLCCSWCRWA